MKMERLRDIEKVREILRESYWYIEKQRER